MVEEIEEDLDQMTRKSQDKTLNEKVKKLLPICESNGLKVWNGRQNEGRQGWQIYIYRTQNSIRARLYHNKAKYRENDH